MNLVTFILINFLVWVSVNAEEAAPLTTDLAPGYSPLPFPAPKPGSYQLPEMSSAADGKVLDSDGKAMNLHETYTATKSSC